VLRVHLLIPTSLDQPDCHCEQRSDEAIQLDCRGALRAPRNDKPLEIKGRWYEGNTAGFEPGQQNKEGLARCPRKRTMVRGIEMAMCAFDS